MTQEEYEAKVQSMPQSLQKMFRESLEIANAIKQEDELPY